MEIMQCLRCRVGEIVLELEEQEGKLTRCEIVDSDGTQMSEVASSPLLYDAVRQLGEYMRGERESFDIPLKLNGTEFQTRVWEALAKIEYGQTVSYSALAEAIGMPRSVRAVANAVGRNPLVVILPCHRIVPKGGGIGGYRYGTGIKRQLLQLERSGSCTFQ